jgi:hypothetical protein
MDLTEERTSDRLAVGLMTWAFPPDMIERAIQTSGRAGLRNRLLSPQIMVYYVLTMCLFPDLGYEAVARRLAEGLTTSSLPERMKLKVIPSTAAVSRARMRLGPEPFRALFTDAAGRPPAGPPIPGSRYGRWRLWALDGRAREFAGEPGPAVARLGRGMRLAAHPAANSVPLRITVLAEGGTGTLAGAEITSQSRPLEEVAKSLFYRLGPADLLIADGEYATAGLWRMAAATGADLLWNLPASRVTLRPGASLGDGSYLAVLPAHGQDAADTEARTVRVVEDSRGGTRRLITTILDRTVAPAAELRGIYDRRWVFADAAKQMEAFRKGRKKTIRSRSPELIEQELWGHLLIYCISRTLANKRLV